MNGLSCVDARRADAPALNRGEASNRRCSPSLRTIGARLLIGAALVFFVVLLTAIFSFLGTLTCCVLIGMMVGSARGSTWRAIPVSLLFPAVTLGLFLFPEPSVPLRKAISLSALCFGSFWATYVVTYAVIALEGKTGVATQEPASGGASQVDRDVDRVAGSPANPVTPDQSSAIVTVKSEEKSADAHLKELQGEWTALHDSTDEGRSAEVIRFTGDRFRFERMGSDGQLQFRWEGTLKCEAMGPFKTMQVSNVSMQNLTHPSPPPVADQTWIYSIAARTLTIASHLDRDCTDRPRLEHYSRSEDRPDLALVEK